MNDTTICQIEGQWLISFGKEFIRVSGVVRIDGRIRRYQDHRSVLPGPGRAASSLPKAHHAVRQSNTQDHINGTNIDAKLQRGRREDNAYRLVPKAGFNGLSFLWH